MEKRALIAFALSMVIFLIWTSKYGNVQKPVKPPATTTTLEETARGPEQTPPAETSEQPKPPEAGTADSGEKTGPIYKPPRIIEVATDLYTASFTESGGRLVSLTLNNYYVSPPPKGNDVPEEKMPPKVNLVRLAEEDGGALGLFFQKAGLDLRRQYFAADRESLTLTREGDTGTLTLTYLHPDHLRVERKFKFTAGSYIIESSVTVENLGDQPRTMDLNLELPSLPTTKKERYAYFGAWINDQLLEIKPNDLPGDLEEQLEEGKNDKIGWAGYEDQYFLEAILPGTPQQTKIKAEPYGKEGVRVLFSLPSEVLQPGEPAAHEYSVFYGPKSLKVLEEAGRDLERAIYFGWVDLLSRPFLIAMTWIHGFVGNFGVAIIIVTVIIKILFWPLTAKSYKSMKNMQKLQPKIMKLREKYKDDRQKMNQEMMQLYRTYKVNPLGGCLPMVIQIPVFIALYRLLDYSLELRHASFLWIHDLSGPDRLFPNPDLSIPFMDSPAGIPVLTLLMGASMILQQKMTPSVGDPTQAKMMMLLPIVFTVIFINFPAGLVLYWLVNNILSIGQQTLVNKSAA